MTLKQILDYGNTLERTDEQSKRLDNASKFQSESNETVNYNYNENNSKQHRKFPTSGGSNSRYRRPRSPIRGFKEINTRKKLQIAVESPKPVVTVEVNSRTKTE